MTVVIFRKDLPKDGGDVFALFPHIPAAPYCCTCYQHVGQHCSANYTRCIMASTPAQPEEYAELLAELVSLGYDDLVICKRRNRREV